jgi:hypothetical protein|tara:strand:- start:468 stop:608 length:141 start_codon:yes stop_codon:yes gene_type:complete
MKQSKVRVPYGNYGQPESAKQGGKFINFNEVIDKKPVKTIKIKRKP